MENLNNVHAERRVKAQILETLNWVEGELGIPKDQIIIGGSIAMPRDIRPWALIHDVDVIIPTRYRGKWKKLFTNEVHIEFDGSKINHAAYRACIKNGLNPSFNDGNTYHGNTPFMELSVIFDDRDNVEMYNRINTVQGAYPKERILNIYNAKRRYIRKSGNINYKYGTLRTSSGYGLTGVEKHLNDYNKLTAYLITKVFNRSLN